MCTLHQRGTGCLLQPGAVPGLGIQKGTHWGRPSLDTVSRKGQQEQARWEEARCSEQQELPGRGISCRGQGRAVCQGSSSGPMSSKPGLPQGLLWMDITLQAHWSPRTQPEWRQTDGCPPWPPSEACLPACQGTGSPPQGPTPPLGPQAQQGPEAPEGRGTHQLGAQRGHTGPPHHMRGHKAGSGAGSCTCLRTYVHTHVT